MLRRYSLASLVALSALAASAAAQTITFEDLGPAGAAPKGFTAATTNKGKPAEWKLQEVAGAPSGRLAVAQVSVDKPSARFPLLVYDAVTAVDGDVTVKFKAVSGVEDQAAGIIWRYTDPNNYYIVRANALEDNVVLYIVKDGKRVDLPVKGKGKTYGAKAPVSKTDWGTLGIQVRGDTFTVILNGNTLYQVEDKTFKGPGKFGLWTKADSVMLFDDMTIENAK
ncbi:MAG: family 16 glycoside hydrolase [Hyphomicrobiaceae bacterium]